MPISTKPAGRDVTIGEAARRSGVNVQTIRFYEQRGLLKNPPRSDGNQRLYAQDQVARLGFIRHARDLGFPLPAVLDLLALSDQPDQTCAAVDMIAQTQLTDVQRRIAALQQLEGELQRMIAQCHGGTVASCRVIESLADHQHCAAEHQKV